MADYDGVEVLWPDTVVSAWLDGKFLYYKDPKTGNNCCTIVTSKPTYSTESHHVWHIDIRIGQGGNWIEGIVSPSIWHHGHFHTPNPVHFRLITEEEFRSA